MNRILSAVLVCALSATLLTACGQKENVGKSAETSSPKTEVAQSSVETKKEELKGKIEFFQQKREAVDTFNAIIEKFQKDNPGIIVEQNNVPDSSQVLTTRMASGDAPDMFTHWPDRAEFKVQIKEGNVLEITNESFLKNIKPAALKMANDMAGTGDKAYALPIALNATGVFYNVKQFNEMALSVPKTYSEFVDILKKIKEAGRVPLALPDKDAWTIDHSFSILSGMFIKDTAAFYSKVQKGDISVKDEPGYKRAAEILLELRQYGQRDTLGTGYDQAIGEFASEKTVMFIQGIWAIPSIKKANPNLEFAMFPFPAEKEEDTGFCSGVDSAVAIASESKNSKLAIKFMSYLSTKDAGQTYADLDKSPSAILGVESNVKEYTLLSNLMDQGKIFMWPYAYWMPGAEKEFRNNVQSLIADKDIGAFLNNQDKLFKGVAK